MKTKRFGLVGLLLFTTGLEQGPRLRPMENRARASDETQATSLTTSRPGANAGTTQVLLIGTDVVPVLTPSLQAKPAQPRVPLDPPKITVSCTLHNHPYDLYNAQTKAVVEKDDWRVTCTVKYKKDTVFDGELPLARPTEFRDAMLAVDEFRTKRAPQLVKEWEDARRTNK
jgi:hypothetical protein